METKITLLIADRNPNVRNYLQREMAAAGYRVRLAENGREVVEWAYHRDPLDLLILDPDLPDIEAAAVMSKLKNRIPPLPVVLHTFTSDYEHHGNLFKDAPFVEKQGNSIERLKFVISHILNDTGPGSDLS